MKEGGGGGGESGLQRRAVNGDRDCANNKRWSGPECSEVLVETEEMTSNLTSIVAPAQTRRKRRQRGEESVPSSTLQLKVDRLVVAFPF